MDYTEDPNSPLYGYPDNSDFIFGFTPVTDCFGTRASWLHADRCNALWDKCFNVVMLANVALPPASGGSGAGDFLDKTAGTCLDVTVNPYSPLKNFTTTASVNGKCMLDIPHTDYDPENPSTHSEVMEQVAAYGGFTSFLFEFVDGRQTCDPGEGLNMNYAVATHYEASFAGEPLTCGKETIPIVKQENPKVTK